MSFNTKEIKTIFLIHLFYYIVSILSPPQKSWVFTMLIIAVFLKLLMELLQCFRIQVLQPIFIQFHKKNQMTKTQQVLQLHLYKITLLALFNLCKVKWIWNLHWKTSNKLISLNSWRTSIWRKCWFIFNGIRWTAKL